MSDSDKKDDDATRIGGGPPLPPKLPTPGAKPPPGPASSAPGGPAADTTHAGGAPPPLPKPSAAPPPAPPPAVPPPPVQKPPPPRATSEADEDPDKTVAIGQTPQRTPFSLQHVQPPGHTSVVYLSRETYLIGRGHSADLALFSPAASREHARLERRADGWYVEPIEDKTVIANGSEVRGAVRLEHKMRLQLGGDELIFFDETAVAPAAVPARAAAASAGRTWSGRWIAVAVGLAAAAAVLAWLLLSARG